MTRIWSALSLSMSRPAPLSAFFSKILWSAFFLRAPWALYLNLANKTILFEWEFCPLPLTPLHFILINDPMGVTFLCVVLLISANVLHFANTYIPGDFNLPRFTFLVLLFILSIALLLIIPHLIALLLGWDGLGLVSFLLIIYYQTPTSWGASIITVLSNRVGDVIILLSIGWILNQGHWTITLISQTTLAPLIIISILIAGLTKRAQIPFSSWLPAAIAAPTPVSALVHSSTLVTAGVFLLIRFYPFLHSFHYFNPCLTLIARLTTLIASLSAIVECDLKKVIALSTLRQLGIIIAAVGLNIPIFAFFHLLTHALFKALLFICAGSLIHIFSHAQDIRQIGNISNLMPLTASTIIISNIALSGIPFLAGYYSKDLILESLIFNPANWVTLLLLFCGTLLTAAYSTRIIILALWSPSSYAPLHNAHNNSRDLTTPASLIALFTILGGRTVNWFFLSPAFEPCIRLTSTTLPLILFITGFSLSCIKTPLISNTNLPFDIFITTWFLTPLTTQKILYSPLNLSHTIIKTVDQGWIETVFGQGLNKISKALLKLPQQLQTNSLTSFILLSSILLIPIWIIL